MELRVNLTHKSYDIIIEHGMLRRIGDYTNLNRKVLVISDDGVPQQYVDTVLSQCPQGYSVVVKQGEGAKSFPVYESLCKKLLELGFSRTDLIIALGGGVIGDLSGFVAATYLRGIEFIGIPTTTLSQIDSSIGGKVAINLESVKNIVGSFYHPSVVLIDPDTLKTLPKRHFANGLVEAVKAGLIYDASILDLFEQNDPENVIDQIIYRSLLVKKDVVEKDEKEQNLRKILNFGHTLGHGIETVYGLHDLLHGECVAIGMMPMLEDEALRQRVQRIYEKLGLKSEIDYDPDAVYQVMTRDKKVQGNTITIVKVKEAGHARLEKIDTEDLHQYLRKVQ
ncbi:MAG: 3-dehydroquinate synthase [Oscillospiraceae bacterium]|nr:3-dehydroquinate synthase [Oscillospiraceae bacterium]